MPASKPPRHPRADDPRSRLEYLSAQGLITIADAHRLARRRGSATHRRGRGRGADGPPRPDVALAAELDEAVARLERRAAARPAEIRYPGQLPVSAEVERLGSTIRDHQVVVVAGATGSGKTTQLPKLCLDLGRGVRGMIGHTQPRRIAARTVADRIAHELDCELGGTVGYQVRFTDRTRDDTLIKVMTDGVLLAEAGRDPDLLRYDTVIVDEAHERSLNIDFLLGYLHRLLPRRPDLKLLITSATIDPQAFADHFGGAPVVEVSGRTYPVEIRYRPRVPDTTEDDDAEGASRPTPAAGAAGEAVDQVTAICDAISELMAEPRGDILVFCSGEREIRDTAAAIKDLGLSGTEILPLYARLSAAEQHRVFSQHSLRRIVLSTNVAETSVTVPGIKYVVDPGTARISRYSRRLKVQRLPIEPISQASADQRAGRCGRLSDGVCLRLYSEADYEGRPAFTDPEILRTSLASVILQMAALRLGRLADFPFLDPPDSRAVTDGERLLAELGALGDPTRHGNTLTPIGRKLADLPLDPRLARMVVAAEDLGVLREVLVIVAGLTIADPRERPSERQQAADTAHARFRVGTASESDFVGWLQLWEYIRSQQKELSSSAFRRMCTREFLHYLRIREWQDLESQLRSACRQLGLTIPSGSVRADVDPELVHRALLPGLLSHVGLRDERRRSYDGARGATFSISPGSSLFRRQPDWVMAAELVETTRLWARTVAGIDPGWIEEAASHLLKHTYSEPHWEARQGQVVAIERATLYGLPVVADRKVSYGRIDPELARELFIRRALVERDWQTRHAFFRRNSDAVATVERLEEKVRRRDLMVDDEVIFEHYDKRIPADVTSAAHFDAWWRKAAKDTPALLDLTAEQLIRRDADPVGDEQFPSAVESGGLTYKLSYAFDPGSDRDGVTANVDVSMLNQLSPETLGWQVPGLRADLLTALIRSLPKNLRRLFVPAPDTAAALLGGGFDPDTGSVVERLAQALTRRAGTPITVDDFDIGSLPEHLRVTYRVTGDGRTLATGKDIGRLQRDLREHMRTSLADAAAGVEQAGLTAWTFGELPSEVEVPGRRERPAVVGYPALVDEGESVAVRILESREAQRDAGWAGQRRLALLRIPSPVRAVLGSLDNASKLALGNSGYPSAAALFDDARLAAVDGLMQRHGAPVSTADAFEAMCTAIRGDLVSTLAQVFRDVADIHRRAETLRTQLDRSGRSASAVLAPSVADMEKQLDDLVGAGFVGRTGVDRLPDLRRYLRGLELRLDRLPGSGGRDLVKLETVEPLQRDFGALLASVPADRPVPLEVADIRWMLQELRISLFAQTLRTAQPVSEKRIRNALAVGRTAVQALTRTT